MLILDAVLVSKTFDERDQALFARLSGDFNPMHIDPLAARRTQAGAPVVHGIHAVLWAVNELLKAAPITEQIISLKVHFTKFIYVGGKVDLKPLQGEGKSIKAELLQDGIATTTLVLDLGERKLPVNFPNADGLAKISMNGSPNNLGIEQLANLSGWMEFIAPADEIGSLFRNAASAIGARRVAAIALSSRLVGMICPGLHSIFSSLALELVDDSVEKDGLGFRVSNLHEKIRMVRMEVSGSGLRGSVQAFVRQPPISQPTINDIAKLVSPTEFAGSTSLIIGGSRGLGEVTAKVIAAGGGKVIVTYAQGREDALRLGEEIRREKGSGVCEVLKFEARENIANQLSVLKPGITHLYYFPTPHIFRQKEGLFVRNLFDDFFRVYVAGFYDCCRYLADHGSRPLIAFYPSSVAVADHPLAMTEYSMAKSAGELLCADMNRAECGIRVLASRLPRLLTDQTATVNPVKNDDPLEIMLPIIRNVQLLRANS
jgi:acyl dehydratase/NAD(P)-dependent dehydrogenase (short-subunit alcohol dehydrogenase family)